MFENLDDVEIVPVEEMPEDIHAWLTKANEIRLNMPEEQAYPWLTFLLDAFSIVDGANFCAVEEVKKANPNIKQKFDCEHLCAKAIDVSPLEAMGIRLAINELLPKVEREAIKNQLEDFYKIEDKKNSTCPFLINNYCAIFPLRPITCRHITEFENKEVACADKAALYAAYAHTSQVYASLGITEKDKTLTFDNFTKLFVDIRDIDWLT